MTSSPRRWRPSPGSSSPDGRSGPRSPGSARGPAARRGVPPDPELPPGGRACQTRLHPPVAAGGTGPTGGPSGSARPDGPVRQEKATMPPEKLHWKHLFDEVVTSGLCTGCSGCVIACPPAVLGYTDTDGVYRPFHLEEEDGPGGCGHGDRGCTSCTRACPRFRAWEPELDEFLFGRAREAQELSGIFKDIVLARASDDAIHEL